MPPTHEDAGHAAIALAVARQSAEELRAQLRMAMRELIQVHESRRRWRSAALWGCLGFNILWIVWAIIH